MGRIGTAVLLTILLATGSYTQSTNVDAELPTVEAALAAILAQDDVVTGQVTDFYRYNYDDSDAQNRIVDGGNDMYDGGNMVYFGTNVTDRIQITYNELYNITNDVSYGSQSSYPFVALARFGDNTDSPFTNFTIYVESNTGADGGGDEEIFNGIFVAGNSSEFFVQYRAYQIYNAGDPSICEVFFTLSSNSVWNSSPVTLEFFQDNPGTGFVDNRAVVSSINGLRNVFLGYTLLSRFVDRSSNTFINESEVRNSVNEILNIIAGQESSIITTTAPIPITTTLPPQENATRVQDLLNSLLLRLPDIRDAVPNYYSYIYDSNTIPPSNIRDGGNDMYDTGNQVNILVDGVQEINLAVYGQLYDQSGYQFVTSQTQPFQAILLIGNPIPNSYGINVASNTGADGNGNIRTFSGALNGTTYDSRYEVFQIAEAGDVTICEVYYYVTQPGATNVFDFTVSFSGTTGNTNNVVTVNNPVDGSILGYTLLSRSNDEFVSQEDVEAVLRITFEAFGTGNTSTPQTTTAETTTAQSTTARPITTAAFTTTRPTSPNATTPFTTAQPTTTPPVTPTTPPSTTDVHFLPSCTLRQAIQRVWSCESRFASQVPYTDPGTCRSNLNGAILCAANKINECLQGVGPNVFYQYNIPFDISSVVTTLRQLTVSSQCYGNDALTSFCSFGLFSGPVPINNPSFTSPPIFGLLNGICSSYVVSRLNQKIIDFYFEYAGAQTKGEICLAFRSFRDSVIPILRNECNLYSLYNTLNVYHSGLYEYISQAAVVVLDTAQTLETSACPRAPTQNNKTETTLAWLKSYVRWRSYDLPKWQTAFTRYLQSLNNENVVVPDIPECLDLTRIRCRNIDQFACSTDVYGCVFCQCLDTRYISLSADLFKFWRQDYYNWQEFLIRWGEVFDAYENSDDY